MIHRQINGKYFWLYLFFFNTILIREHVLIQKNLFMHKQVLFIAVLKHSVNLYKTLKEILFIHSFQLFFSNNHQIREHKSVSPTSQQ